MTESRSFWTATWWSDISIIICFACPCLILWYVCHSRDYTNIGPTCGEISEARSTAPEMNAAETLPSCYYLKITTEMKFAGFPTQTSCQLTTRSECFWFGQCGAFASLFLAVGHKVCLRASSARGYSVLLCAAVSSACHDRRSPLRLC